jgi:hypothetical protein
VRLCSLYCCAPCTASYWTAMFVLRPPVKATYNGCFIRPLAHGQRVARAPSWLVAGWRRVGLGVALAPS